MELGDFVPEAGPGGYERLYINHKGGGFRSSNSDVIVPKQLDVIMLGKIVQRKMWPRDEVKAATGKRGELCSSPNGENGIPKANFPWLEFHQQNGTMIAEGEILCQACPFTAWSRSGPMCQERWYVPVFQGDFHDFMVMKETDKLAVKIMEFTQSGVKPLQEHFAKMKNQFKYPFEFVTRVKTIGQTSQSGKFAVPKFLYSGDIMGYFDEHLRDKFFFEAMEAITTAEKNLFDSAMVRSRPATGGSGGGFEVLR